VRLVAITTNGVLTLTNVQALHQGTYSVIVSNFIGEITNKIAELVVQTNALIAAQSGFDSDAEDWSVVGTTLRHSVAGGNPGGHIAALGVPEVRQWYWVAPPSYLGNKFYCYNGSLSFELRQLITSTEQAPAEDVILEGAGLRLVIDWTNLISAAWTTYRIPLNINANEHGRWRVGSLAGPPPSRQQFVGVLTSLTNLMIRGASGPSSEFGQIDSVLLLGSTTPSLSIRRDGDDWVVEWPQALSGYSLQQSTTVSPTLWSTITTPAVQEKTGLQQAVEHSTLNSIRVDTNATLQFFRLHKP
jgi:hypothetical protein